MAEPTERTALLDQADPASETTFLNMAFGPMPVINLDGGRGMTGSADTVAASPHGSADPNSSDPHNGADPRSSEGSYLSVEEFLYRLQYAFLRNGYDMEGDLRLVIRDCDNEGFDQLVQALNSAPLPMYAKIHMARILRSEGKSNRRNRRGTTNIEKGQSADKMLRRYHLWDDTITRLAAYFGSNVASYFRFVRTLVYMNLFMSLIMLAFITIPEVLDGTITSNTTFGGHFGELSDSIMFYGLYDPSLGFTYNMPLAYFLSWLVANVVCFIYIIIIMIRRYKKKKLSEDKANEYRFAWRAFAMWDYSITSRHGVMDHRTALRTDIKEIVKEDQSEIEESMSTRCRKYLVRVLANGMVLSSLVGGGLMIFKVAQKDNFLTHLRQNICWKYFMRVLANVMVLGILVGSGFMIFKVAQSEDILPDAAPDSWKDLFQRYQLTAVVAGLKFLVPPIFHQIVTLEGWHPRIENKITLARTTLFYIASLIVFVSSLYEATDDCQALNTTMITMDETCCWENEVGEEVLKVVLLDLGLLVVVGILVHFTRAVIVKCCCTFLGYSKFDVVSCVLDVIYGQALIWMGLYFSPILALLGLVKLVVVFYIRFTIAKVAMVPPQQMFRASSTGNFYLAILLLHMFVSLFPMAYAVIEFSPSPECGPFRKFEFPYRVVSAAVGDLPDWLEEILDFLGTTSVLVPLLVLLIMSTVYFKVKSASYNSLVAELRRQLKFERKVEKRKIFATGRAMSSASLYTAPDSPAVQPRGDRSLLTQKSVHTIAEVEEIDHSSV